MSSGASSRDGLERRIAELEIQLETAKLALSRRNAAVCDPVNLDTDAVFHQRGLQYPLCSDVHSRHNLLLLADSAFPLGSFAYSNGLESFLAHHKLSSSSISRTALLHKFLHLSVLSVAHTNLPYVLAGYRSPELLSDLDNDLDASTPCKVAREASIAQGRALLSIWEKSLRTHSLCQSQQVDLASQTLETFGTELKLALQSKSIFGANGHLAPLFGVVSLALNQDINDVAYLFLFNHAKATVSAAVRASVLGPYSAQSVLAGNDLQELIQTCVAKVWDLSAENAGQVVPPIDLWIGRHELLYSKIFNS